MPYTPMPPEYWRQRRQNNPKYQAQERARNKRRLNKRRVHEQTRRARLANAFVEVVDPVLVFERDLYVCQRCWCICPTQARVPQSNAPTLDHIVPLSKGGLHSYENVQTLCSSCNSQKGNRTD
jgi:5-methylcytosine-specific restriction endonuclease McrA